MAAVSTPPTPRSALALGVSDFVELRERGLPYVDKTAAIASLVRQRNVATVFCRPRRFGKSLFLSTLRCFFEKSPVDRSALFDGLAVRQDAQAWEHFQRHPVLHLSFKELAVPRFETAIRRLGGVLQRELQAQIERWPGLQTIGGRQLDRLLQGEADLSDLMDSLVNLTHWLSRVAGQRAIVLLDEYDTPLHAAQSFGYFEPMAGFLRSLLGAGLKENPSLHQAVITGVLRVSREGLWSSVNNLAIYSVLDRDYADAFGFTEPEVEALCQDVATSIPFAEMKRWYNGYTFGDTVLYNPWSVLHALQRDELGAWWVETGSNEALGRLVRSGGAPVQRRLVRWMAGETLRDHIGDTVLLRDERPRDVVALLVHGGYLSPVGREKELAGWSAALRVPNLDALQALREAADRWLSDMCGDPSDVAALSRALLTGDADFGRVLGSLLGGAASAHDFPFPDQERGYHVFLLGLLCWLRPRYQVLSEVETGLGRADILLLPTRPGDPAALIEMKRVASPAALDEGVAAALAQVADRRYDQRLVEAGAGRVYAWGIAFCGKECRAALAGAK